MIRLSIAKSVVDLSVDQWFVGNGTAAQTMHIAMMNPIARNWSGGNMMVTVEASPEEWDLFRAWCSERSVVPVGVNRERRAEAAKFHRAAEKIDHELQRLANHPAYRGIGVAGIDRTRFPARRCGGSRWWPTDLMALAHSDGTTFAVERADLIPRTERRNGRAFTVWSAASENPVGTSTEASLQ